MRTARSPASRQLLVAAMAFLCIGLTLAAAACSASTEASITSVPRPVSSSFYTVASSPVASSIKNSAKIAVDLGPADQINLHEAWLQVAKACSFDAKGARAWDLLLDYSPSGSLVNLFLIAITADSREVRVSWDGHGGLAGQVVRASVTTAIAGGEPKSITDHSMYSVLAAIDAVGVENITGKLPEVGAGGIYALGVMFLDAYKGALPPGSTAYSWDGSAFEPLTGRARSLKLDSEQAALSVAAGVPVAPTTTTLSASTSSTYGISTATTSPYESIAIAYFVIPITSAQGTTTTGAETTTTSQLNQFDTRIGVMIPGDILYKGRIYTGGFQVVKVASNMPADLSVVGSGHAADVTGAPDLGAQYAIYAIKGIDPGKVIAVQFRAASNDGPVWVWLKYERKT